MFIDTLEIEEILGEYYDFEAMTQEDWSRADQEIKRLCLERGIFEPDGGDEEYYKICDGVIGKIMMS